MAYGVHFCALSANAEINGLARLPETVSWRLFEATDGSHYRIDFFREAGEPQTEPVPNWLSGPERHEIPLFFDDRDSRLTSIYRDFLKEKLAGAMSRPTAVFALMLGRAVRGDVLVAYADDDGTDAACLVRHGELERWSFKGIDELITIERSGEPIRRPTQDTLLHMVAADEVQSWLGRLPSFMSTFEPKPEAGLYRLVRQHVGTDPSEMRDRMRSRREWNANNPNPKKLANWKRRNSRDALARQHAQRHPSLRSIWAAIRLTVLSWMKR